MTEKENIEEYVDRYYVDLKNGYTLAGPGQYFDEEENAQSDKEWREATAEAKKLIAADGFIRYPLFFKDLKGNPIELEAWLHPTFEPSSAEGFKERHGMNYNIYIPSYQRDGSFYGTMDVLDKFNVKNYYLCIDPDQYEEYKKHWPLERLVIRDIEFRRKDLLDTVSSMKRPMKMAGHAPLCNFTLSLSKSLGEERFWFMDDDFTGLAMKAYKGDTLMPAGEVYDKNNFYRCSNIEEVYGFDFKKFMSSLEELTMKMRNPGFVGLEKFGTVFTLPVCFRRNTRVYSYYLTTNETQPIHYAVQNNDVGVSIEHTKNGHVDMLFEGISYNSLPTQAAGGQADMYKTIGTLDKGKVLVRNQPNFSKLTYEYSRIHHACNFVPLIHQRLVGQVKSEEEK